VCNCSHIERVITECATVISRGGRRSKPWTLQTAPASSWRRPPAAPRWGARTCFCLTPAVLTCPHACREQSKPSFRYLSPCKDLWGHPAHYLCFSYYFSVLKGDSQRIWSLTSTNNDSSAAPYACGPDRCLQAHERWNKRRCPQPAEAATTFAPTSSLAWRRPVSFRGLLQSPGDSRRSTPAASALSSYWLPDCEHQGRWPSLLQMQLGARQVMCGLALRHSANESHRCHGPMSP